MILVDFHSHILPAADHGSDGIETSLCQMKRAVKAGIGITVATPHFYLQHHTVQDFLERRERAYSELVSALDGEGIHMDIIPAAEVTLRFDLPALPELEKLCIGDSNYILLEMPDSTGASWIYDALYKIESVRRLRPIIAHLDRYPKHMQDRLLDMELPVQLNAEALCRVLGRRKYIDLYRSGQAHFLGSDVHFKEAPQYTQYERAVDVMRRAGVLGDVMDCSLRVLENKSV